MYVAAEKANVTVRGIYNYQKNDPEFKEMFDEARDSMIAQLEDMALTRAITSDTMLIFMLKCNYPEKYADRREINMGGNLTVNLNMVVDNGD